MRSGYLFSLCFLLLGSVGFLAAQEPEPVKGFDKSKLFFGGNFGLSFGNNTMINVSPQAGYRFNRYFAAGAGINAQYVSYRTRNYDGSTFSKENYGVGGLNIFGRLYPIRQAFLQVQPELNYTWGKYKQYTASQPSEIKIEGKTVPSVLLGAGAALPAGSGAFIIMVQYDVIQNNRSPYSNKPFVSFGYNF